MVLILDGSSEHGAHIYGVHQVFRFVEGIWLLRKSRHIRIFFSEGTYVRNMVWATILYKYHEKTRKLAAIIKHIVEIIEVIVLIEEL